MSPDPRARLRYQLDRDDDLRVFDNQPVVVHLPADPDWNRQLAAITLADLLGRLFPNVTLDVPSSTRAALELPPGPPSVADRFSDARSKGGLRPTATADAGPIHVAVGAPTVDAHVHIDAHGWQSYIGQSAGHIVRTVSRSPIGALAAACRAAAHITRLAAEPGAHAVPESSYTDALTLERSTTPLPAGTPVAWDVPGAPLVIDAVTAGAGSVVGAAVYTLRHVPQISGTLTIIDPQDLEPHNWDRAILVDRVTAAGALPKVDVAAAALNHHTDLAVSPVRSAFEEWVASGPPRPLPLVVCAVDSAEARRGIQDCLPLDLVNAACDHDLVVVSRHRTDDGPCMCCLHMADVVDTEQALHNIVVAETGLPKTRVLRLLQDGRPLTADDLRSVEAHLGLDSGHLDKWVGQPLVDLHRRGLMYGRLQIDTPDGPTVVAAPFATALAGVLLAAETLKYFTPGVESASLGPQGAATTWSEKPTGDPFDAMTERQERWPGHECLCRSARRNRIVADRYGVG